MNKNKFTVIGIVLTTVILAGVAIFTAIRLYQTRNQAVAPNAPSSRPNAQVAPTTPAIACQLSFTITVSTATPTTTATAAATRTPTPTPTRTATPTTTATATAVPQCNTTCSTSSECPSSMTCYKPTGSTSGNCRNTQCTTSNNCFCATATPTATATSTATSVATSTSTAVATVTATATANPQCNYACTSNSNCPSGMICYIPSGSTSGNCRNTQCLSETDCACAVTTSTPTYVATATDQPTLPEVGTTWPTLLGTGFGILVIIGSLLLAL
ncbi:MAG: hypothetical protein AAB778_01915 [Patescibacteria group bacterium]